MMEPTFRAYQQIRRSINHWILDKQYYTDDKIAAEHFNEKIEGKKNENFV